MVTGASAGGFGGFGSASMVTGAPAVSFGSASIVAGAPALSFGSASMVAGAPARASAFGSSTLTRNSSSAFGSASHSGGFGVPIFGGGQPAQQQQAQMSQQQAQMFQQQTQRQIPQQHSMQCAEVSEPFIGLAAAHNPSELLSAESDEDFYDDDDAFEFLEDADLSDIAQPLTDNAPDDFARTSIVSPNKLVVVDPKLAEIETLYRFIRFQSFDGFFKPTAELSGFFSREKDKNLFQNKDQDSVWSTCIALAYLEIVMKGFKEEWELCYEKAQTALDELSGYDASTIEKLMQDARKWVTEWYA
ncbi:9494_t:CDS:2 [Paraglomus occultum]|uniref:9494_t:CDS:1 n=1 Tax=Paraglomus occultum TaxID=144539 RepID=A0A9N9GBY6_9GLOM|nr:9494_t:CDS:2 [Paraglomus occultum]